MGMYDDVFVFDKCPYCKRHVMLHGQTKDLGRSLFCYKAMHRGYLDDDKSDDFYNQDRELRRKLKTGPRFPEDKAHSVWKSQLEMIRAEAKIPEKYQDLNEISVFFECPSHTCKSAAEKMSKGKWGGLSKTFEAKLPVVQGYLIAELSDLELNDKYLSANWFKYPKIQTLWMRDAENKAIIVEGDYSRPEFPNLALWSVTEKIHGQNIRVLFENDEVFIGGRTDAANLHPEVRSALHQTFTLDTVSSAFSEAESVILFGEAVGPKIHDVGSKYSDKHEFILFDVVVDGWWLEQSKVEDVAKKLGVRCAPFLGLMTKEEIQALVKSAPNSLISKEPLIAEGVVARSYPLMMFRDKTPIMFKLKVSDYKKLEKHKGDIL